MIDADLVVVANVDRGGDLNEVAACALPPLNPFSRIAVTLPTHRAKKLYEPTLEES